MVPHMMAIVLAVLAVPVMPATATAGSGPESGRDPLAAYRWTHRVVVALAPSRQDPGLAVQRRIFDAMGPAAAERDLVLVAFDDATPEGAALRRRFGGGTAFRAILVGKDGGEKLSSSRPLEPDVLLSTIDAMPMRRQEMRRTPCGAAVKLRGPRVLKRPLSRRQAGRG